MKTFVAQCAALVLTITLSVSEGILWPYSRDVLRAGSPVHQDRPKPSYHKIPSSLWDPRSEEFTQVEADDCRPVNWYCLDNDISYCIAYDYLGNVAAIQIGYLKEYADKVDQRHYNFANNTNYKEKEWFNKPFYAVEIWVTNPEQLTPEGRHDLTEIIEGLWAFIDGELVRFDHRCQTVGPSIGDFDLQGCLPKKGTLYVYKFNKYTNCQNGFFLFLVYDKGSLAGFGHAAPGNYPSGPQRDWFDRPKGDKHKIMVPSPPSCYKDIISYGFVSSVTFLIDEPYNIRCPVCAC